MARVTVEDCILKVDNRFELVLIAARRARLLFNGEESSLPKDNDKHPVIALREIAEGTISLDELKENVVKSFQLYPNEENQDEEELSTELNENQEELKKEQNLQSADSIDSKDSDLIEIEEKNNEIEDSLNKDTNTPDKTLNREDS